MSTFFKAMAIAFSMYSTIPMPQFTWQEKEMKYVFCFFPWVGAVIGALLVGWNWICEKAGIGELAWVLVGTAVPLIVTGGFHVDGFMDTMDAFHSYQERERKLEILKDSHIGAFSVICLLLYYLLYLAGYSEIDGDSIYLLASIFFLSRILSAAAAVTMKGAKTEGLLYLFSSRVQERTVKISLLVQFVLVAGFMLYQSVVKGGILLVGALCVFLYYKHRCYKELGGVTGDTAGYFLTLCEGVLVVLLGIAG